MGLLTTQALLVSKVSKDVHNHHPSEALSVTLLFELAKLTLSASLLFLQKRKTPSLPLRWSWSECNMYAIPALIYLINDNLLFYILRFMEPTTFEVLGNFKILTTSLLLR